MPSYTSRAETRCHSRWRALARSPFARASGKLYGRRTMRLRRRTLRGVENTYGGGSALLVAATGSVSFGGFHARGARRLATVYGESTRRGPWRTRHRCAGVLTRKQTDRRGALRRDVSEQALRAQVEPPSATCTRRLGIVRAEAGARHASGGEARPPIRSRKRSGSSDSAPARITTSSRPRRARVGCSRSCCGRSKRWSRRRDA